MKAQKILVLMISLWLISSSIGVAEVQKGLVAYWSFDEGKGNIVKDVSGNENDVIVHGATWVEGISGNGLSFDGKDDYAICKGKASLSFPEAFTMEVWVYPQERQSVTDRDIILLKVTDYLTIDISGKISVYLAGLTEPGYWNSNATVPLRQWSHLAVTYSSATGEIKLYLNGKLDKTIQNSGTLVPGKTLHMGAEITNNNRFFKGFIDEVKIYNKALTEEEIRKEYQKFPSHLVNKEKTLKGLSPGTELVSTRDYKVSKDWIPIKRLGKDFWFLWGIGSGGEWWNKRPGIEDEPMIKESGRTIYNVFPPLRGILGRITIREIEVFGSGSSENLAGKAKVSGWCEEAELHCLKKINDGDSSFDNVCFSSPFKRYHQQKGWIELDFGKKVKINKVILHHGYGDKEEPLYRISHFSLQSGPSWKNVLEIKRNQLPKNILSFKPLTINKIRIYIYGQLSESISITNLKKEVEGYCSTQKPFNFCFLQGFRDGDFLGLDRDSVDYESYTEWKKKYQDSFLGFWMTEWVNNINGFYNWNGVAYLPEGGYYTEVVGKEYAKKYPPLPLPRKRKEACNLLEKIFKWQKEVLFNDVFSYDGGGATFNHYSLEWGANLTGTELSSCYPYSNYHARTLFTRSAARQYHKEWLHYQAYYYIGAVPFYIDRNWKPMSARKTSTGDNIGPDFGLPVSLGRRSLYHSYFMGGNYFSFEADFQTLLQDKNNDGIYELSPHGEVLKEIFNFAKKHERGIHYTPAAFLLDYYHGWKPNPIKKDSVWFNLPFQKGDYMVDRFMQAIYPVKENRGLCIGLVPTPYGEIFDVLIPNPPSGTIPLSTLDNYKVLVPLGDININKELAERLIEYVKEGGTLLLNQKQVNDYFPERFLGVKPTGKPQQVSNFEYQPVKLLHAKSLIEDKESRIMVTQNRYGKGNLIFTTPSYLLSEDEELLPFVHSLLEQIVKEVLPFQVKGDIAYQFNKKKDGWLLILMNNRGVIKDAFKPEELDFSKTARVEVILTNRPKRITELRTGKRIKYRSEKDFYTFTTKVLPGDVQVLELSF